MINYYVSPDVSNDELNTLFAAAWSDHRWSDFEPLLRHSLAYVCAYIDGVLIGFVNLAWDGGIHAFLLDTTVHPTWQRRGIGRQLVRQATAAERNHFELLGHGTAIGWPDLDEHLSVESILAGRSSGESQRSFQRWLTSRART